MAHNTGVWPGPNSPAVAQKPRLKVTLSASTYATIERLAELNNCSMSSVVGDLVEGVAPSMAGTLAMLEAAEHSSVQTKQKLVSAMEGIERDLIGALGSSHAVMHHELSKAIHSDASKSKPQKRSKRSKSRT